MRQREFHCRRLEKDVCLGDVGEACHRRGLGDLESPPPAQNAFSSPSTCSRFELGHWCLHAGAHGKTCVCPGKPSGCLGLPALHSVLIYHQCLAVTRLRTRIAVRKVFGLPVSTAPVTNPRILQPGTEHCSIRVAVNAPQGWWKVSSVLQVVTFACPL